MITSRNGIHRSRQAQQPIWSKHQSESRKSPSLLVAQAHQLAQNLAGSLFHVAPFESAAVTTTVDSQDQRRGDGARSDTESKFVCRCDDVASQGHHAMVNIEIRACCCLHKMFDVVSGHHTIEGNQRNRQVRKCLKSVEILVADRYPHRMAPSAAENMCTSQHSGETHLDRAGDVTI